MFTYATQSATTTAVVSAVGGDMISTVLNLLGIILAAAVLFIGIGWGVAKFRKYVMGGGKKV